MRLSEKRSAGRRFLVMVAASSLAVAATPAVTSAKPEAARSPGAATSARAGGTVRVLYAGSLEELMNSRIAAAFHRATGYTLDGYPAGSKDLASEIKGRVRQGDVFISASPKVDATLQGKSNGNWVSWYAPFATTRLVIGYNPSSPFASALRSQSWYQAITQPGFRFGFTDPTLDPKGVLAVDALDAAAARYHVPALRAIATDQNDLFPEQDLVGRLQSGQLDAGFFYTVEASAAKIPTVSLGSIDETATYTVTVLNRAPNPAGAESFVKFLLSRNGDRLLRQVGLSITKPVAVGTGVPYLLGSVIKR